MKRLLLALFIFFGVIYASPVSADIAPPNSQDVYRFWSPVFKSHFYTIDYDEAMYVKDNDNNWVYEGSHFEAFDYDYPGSTPVYRFWSPVFHKHFYTADYQEYNNLVDSDPNWTYEHIDFYAYPISYPGPSQEVWRFWSPNFDNAHFYTTSDLEKQQTESDRNWDLEGVAFRVPAD
ncbi:hypothetical protein KJ855_01615 [Patescibacteria group bacterium]|nr:hypothetical protein [Patescibacteria group bacterium]